jgi:hypothetical protein
MPIYCKEACEQNATQEQEALHAQAKQSKSFQSYLRRAGLLMAGTETSATHHGRSKTGWLRKKYGG